MAHTVGSKSPRELYSKIVVQKKSSEPLVYVCHTYLLQSSSRPWQTLSMSVLFSSADSEAWVQGTDKANQHLQHQLYYFFNLKVFWEKFLKKKINRNEL